MDNTLYPEFTNKMRDLSKIYNNFSAILEKTDVDGYLNRIYIAITDILGNEMHFALGGNLKRAQKHKWAEKTFRTQKTS